MILLELTGRSFRCNTISAIKTLRELTGCGLADAKSCIERILEGQAVRLELNSPVSTQKLVDELKKSGLHADVQEFVSET